MSFLFIYFFFVQNTYKIYVQKNILYPKKYINNLNHINMSFKMLTNKHKKINMIKIYTLIFFNFSYSLK